MNTQHESHLQTSAKIINALYILCVSPECVSLNTTTRSLINKIPTLECVFDINMLKTMIDTLKNCNHIHLPHLKQCSVCHIALFLYSHHLFNNTVFTKMTKPQSWIVSVILSLHQH
jgi:hypothetical protein